MPSVSKKQHNAMEAAAHGKSTLGIPKSVGEDFSQADKGKKFAGGGPVTAASIEGGSDRGMFNGSMATPVKSGGWDGGGLTNPTPTSSPAIKPISTTDTLPGGGGPNMTGPTNPFANGSGLTPTKSGGWGGGGLTPSPGDPSPTEFQVSGSPGNFYEDGGMVGPNTAGTSYSFPPPPGQRKQGPRNYSKKG